MREELVSVIVAVYNVELYLNRCIQSLLEQTYQHLEIILVDDGSTDESAAICDKWARKDGRITVIHKRNGGVSDARNAGIRAAHGKWLGFVDGDDYVVESMYDNLYRHRTEKGITVCGYYTEQRGRRQAYPAIESIMTPQEALDLYLDNELKVHYEGIFTFLGSYLCNKLYDSSLFMQISFPIGKKYEDMYIFLDVLNKAERVCCIPSCEYIYVQRDHSTTHTANNIRHESLEARLWQKEQLQNYWGKMDNRIVELISCEYFLILYRYACLPGKDREKNKETAIAAWKSLREIGYRHFPATMQIKLFLFVHCAWLFRFLRALRCNIKGLYNG